MRDVSLRRLASISYGLGQPPRLSESGVPILRATNIDRGRISRDGLIFAERSDLPLGRVPLLRSGEVLVVRSGAYTGDSALVTSEWAGSSPGYDLRVSPRDRLDPRFLAYSLLGQRALDAMWIASSRAAQPHLNAEELGDVPVMECPLAAQRAIADFLDTETARIDALIAKKRRMIDLLSARWSESARRVLTFDNRYSNPLVVESTESCPPGVAPYKLSWVARFGGGTTPASRDDSFFGGPVAWVVTGDLNDGDVVASSRTVTESALAAYSALKVHPPGSLVVAMYGATIGKLGVLRCHATVNQACCVISPSEALDPDFLFLYLLAFRQELVELGRGSGQPNISQEMIRSLRLPLPSNATQREIVARLRRSSEMMRKMTSALSSQLALLKEHRQALITAAVTGELDVSGVAA